MRMSAALLALSAAAAWMQATAIQTSGASADGVWQPQTIDATISSDQSVVWRATITYTPSFTVTPGGELSVRFGGRVAVRSSTRACVDAGGGDSCLEKWHYPEQHITSIRVTFDRGTAASKPLGLTDGGHADLPIPAGATMIAQMEATVGDAGANTAHDSRGYSTDVTRQPGTLVFPDMLRLSDGGRVDVAATAPGSVAPFATGANTPTSEPLNTTAWPWYAAALAAAAAAIAAASRLRRFRAEQLKKRLAGVEPVGGVSVPTVTKGVISTPVAIGLGIVATGLAALGRWLGGPDDVDPKNTTTP